MPPANSPIETRPSTPPAHPPSSSSPSSPSNPYLRQLEEAISTPVADLASTLNLTPSQQGTYNRHLYLRQLPDVDDSHDPDLFATRQHLSELEFRDWLSLPLPSTTDLGMERQPPSTTQPRDRAQIYATRGDGPSRQSLYDWAVTRPERRTSLTRNNNTLLDDDSDDDLERSSTSAPNSNDPAARRDLQRLERALQSYRDARSALTPARSSDYGPVPTASALRAYWQEDPNDSDTTTRPWLPPLTSSNTSRRMHPHHLRLQTERDRRQHESSSHLTTRKERKRSEAIARVRNLIRYLSQLRHTGIQGGLDLARELDLDSLYESEEANTPSDLPMHVNSLPVPQYSSWLQPGMVWHGVQSTDREPVRSVSMIVSSARRERHRDLLRRTLARRRELGLGGPQEDPDQLASDTLLDSERWLSDLRQSTDGRWAFGSSSNAARTTSSPDHPQHAPESPASDHWPVSVSIHSVDYNTMTLTGTMSASHIPDKTSTLHQAISEHHAANTSMSSFFTGEIIDFRQQPLETEPEGRNYSVGGLDVDARYWARLGPFREEIRKVRNLRGKHRSEYQHDSRLWDAFRKAAGVDADNKDPATDLPETDSTSANPSQPESIMASDSTNETEDDEIMARSLGSARWIEEKLGREWILMRWKERCFVTPNSQTGSRNQEVIPNADNTRTILTAPSSSWNVPGAPSSNGASTSWGLTISGFYYIALNRLTGEIDGLYYDPGSQPYQALKMVPEGTSLHGLINSADGGSQGSSTKAEAEHGPKCGCGDQQCRDRPGLKKWFPSLDFR